MNRFQLGMACLVIAGTLEIPSAAAAQKPSVEEGKKLVNGVELYYKAIVSFRQACMNHVA